MEEGSKRSGTNISAGNINVLGVKCVTCNINLFADDAKVQKRKRVRKTAKNYRPRYTI